MKKHMKKGFITILLILILIILSNQRIFAKNNQNSFQKVEYSEDFKKWLELSEEEKKNTMQPRMYDVLNTNINSTNPLNKLKSIKASVEPRYSLKDVIPNNLTIRNQQETNSCWAFAALSCLETNLALADYKSGMNQSKVYDFSERHMEYATSKNFKDGKINNEGYNRIVGEGGNWAFAESYLTNGTGAIIEEEMPFKNNEDIIDISEIQNKSVSSQVYDTIDFPDYQKETEENKTEIMNQIKQHIQDYGSVYAGIHGNSSSTTMFNCYNNDTGAKYCDNSIMHGIDHAVSIIGWDDNYSIDNFAENMKPKANGAWIVRNSWGEKIELSISELKEKIFEENKDYCIEQGWTESSLIPNEVITDNGYTIEGDIAYKKIGDNGLIYVSYEDANVSKTLFGIVKAEDKTKYENIYQYDRYFPAQNISYATSNIILCNVFDKKTQGTEYLTQVSLYAPETYTCKVYVNPNGSDKNKENMQFVKLEAGDTETISPGYHTLEFAKPIEIKGNKYAVAIEIQGTRNNTIYFSLEAKVDGVNTFDSVTVENNKCFITAGNDFDNSEWIDLSTLSQINPSLSNGDGTIKAFTTSKIVDESLKNIEIAVPPTKTSYLEGENFDKTGMIIKANYNDGISITLDDSSYNITNGNNLKAGQTSVMITYENKSVNQPITVEKNSVTELKIKTPPIKTEYKEGESFDKNGMEVEATYKDGTKKIITDYIIKDGNNLKTTQTEVTIEYDGKTIKQPITVTENPLMEIKVTKEPDKIKYVVGQDFDKTGMVVTGTYKDGSNYEIKDYIIENGTNLTKGQTFVTIKYENKTTTQEITVEEKSIVEITINKKPTKLTYIQNKEELDLEGGELKVTYNDGTTETIPMDSKDVTVSEFSNKTLGKIKIVVTYKSKNIEFEVEIIEEDEAENSNLDNINCNLKELKAIFYKNKPENSYSIMKIEINNIIKKLTNDSLEYYYYLSSKQNENKIENWNKVTEEQNANDKLNFTIDSRKVANFEELSENQDLYIYIKEVAKKGGNQSTLISKPLKIEVNDNTQMHVETIEDENQSSGEDNTTAPGKLPQTGAKTIIAISSIIIIITIGTIFFFKFNKVKDIK